MPRCNEIVAALACVAAVTMPHTPAAADQVVLRLKGSDIEVAGHLRTFDGSKYTLEVGAGGVLSLDAALYECSGASCAAPAGAPVPPPGTSTFVFDTPAAPTKPITIEGSGTIGHSRMPALIRAYAVELVGQAKQLVGGNARESRFRITDSRGGEFASFDLKRYGAEAAFKSLQDGSAVIGLATRPISLQETSALTQTRPQLRIADFEHVLGLDGLVVIVPPGSPATALSVDAIARIFSGTVTNWSAVGLPAGPINIYISSERTGSADTFADLVLKPRALTLSAAATRVADEAELSDAVARDPNAIGITSFAFLRNARGLDIVTPCGIVAKPTPFAVKAEEYPLGRRIYLYTAGQPAQPAAQELVRFVVSRRAQEIIRDAAFIDQSIESTPFLDQKPRIDAGLQPPGTIAYAADQVRQFVGEVGQARRLSVTFRFAMGDTRLDAKARGDLGRLAELLKSPEMSGKTVVFAGFTDVVGKPWLNQMLSLKRAQEVRDAILQSAPGLAAGKKILAFGYGPAAPVVCNESERADQNRRVEVWIRDEPATAVAARPTGGTALTQTPDPAAQPAAAAKTGRKKRFR